MVETTRRPRFVRTDKFVATQRITIVEGTYIEPGEPIPDTIRRPSLMRWFARRMIGPVGHPWTHMLLRRRLHILSTDKAAGRLHPAGDAEIERIGAALEGHVEADQAAARQAADAKAKREAEVKASIARHDAKAMAYHAEQDAIRDERGEAKPGARQKKAERQQVPIPDKPVVEKQQSQKRDHPGASDAARHTRQRDRS